MLYQIIRAPSPEKLLAEGHAMLEQFKQEEEKRRRRHSVSGMLAHAVSRRLSMLSDPQKEKDPSPPEGEEESRSNARSSAIEFNVGESGEAGSDLEQACLTHEEEATNKEQASGAI